MSVIREASDQAIAQAVRLLQDGQVVAFPTETVYGLGANALNGQAVAGIFEAKQRPQFNPLIVHFTDMKAAQAHAVFDDRTLQVGAQFWPGPLTMILPRQYGSEISELVSAGLPTIAVRVPSHPAAQKLLKGCGFPLAAPSANASGEPSATTPMHVAESLKDRAAMILAAGACQVGLESTVLDLSDETPVILRPGAITAEDLAPVLGEVGYDFGHKDKPKSPGQILKHYAPNCPVRLNAVDLEPGEALLAFGSDKFMGIRGGGAAKDLPESMRANLSESGDLNEAAANLFAMLRALDKPEHKAIAVMNIPDTGLGVAINERLQRAAAG